MKSVRISILLLLFSLPLCSAVAQEKAERETDIHNNVKLLEMPVPSNIPEEFKAQYQVFLGRLKQALKDKTGERSSTNALTIQVRPGIKEIGQNRTKQPAARITAFKKDSKSEYVANFLLHSYATGDTVNKEEIERFLTLQILNPLEMN
ncbi:MAG: hypothetical protein JXA73_18920 [Acidobacteria bacterium]|nr:hypothetical protein [Acidobacteriota bacterium]